MFENLVNLIAVKHTKCLKNPQRMSNSDKTKRHKTVSNIHEGETKTLKNIQ